jgi:hypothetical protein
MASPRRFPPPWIAEVTPNCFIVRDANGQALSYIYYESEPGRRMAAKLLSDRFEDAELFHVVMSRFVSGGLGVTNKRADRISGSSWTKIAHTQERHVAHRFELMAAGRSRSRTSSPGALGPGRATPAGVSILLAST